MLLEAPQFSFQVWKLSKIRLEKHEFEDVYIYTFTFHFLLLQEKSCSFLSSEKSMK